jgi:hypothetical protein
VKAGSLPLARRAGAFALLIMLSGAPAHALHESAGQPPQAAERYKLPISPPRDQGDSGLCWVFATLSMLETNYMEAHPGSKIELSRGALQREAIADRLRRLAKGGPAYLEEGGIAIDALALIRADGLVAEGDFHDFVDADPVFATLARRVRAASGEAAKLKALDGALDARLGAPPAKTHLDGRVLTPPELAKAVVGDGAWAEYDLSRDGVARVGRSEDPDARPGAIVHYAPLSTLIDLIHGSLKRGQAVVWGSTDDHALLIFGGDYDVQGRPISYWVKDSFAPYVYRAPAEQIHRQLTDVTVEVSPESERTAASR